MDRKTLTVLIPLSCCLLLVALAAPAAAASQHAVTLEWVFTGASCPLSTVVVSASSCDGDDIATELSSEMTSAGLSVLTCAYFPTNDDWECAASFPTSCTLVDTTMSIKPGFDCTDDMIQGQNYGPSGSYVIFIYDVP